MSRDAGSRVEVGLSSLVAEFLPPRPTDEKGQAGRRHQEALEAAKEVIEEYSHSRRGVLRLLTSHADTESWKKPMISNMWLTQFEKSVRTHLTDTASLRSLRSSLARS